MYPPAHRGRVHPYFLPSCAEVIAKWESGKTCSYRKLYRILPEKAIGILHITCTHPLPHVILYVFLWGALPQGDV